jgi:DNA-directed RNA polymerase specialized sigma24 family protein
MLGTKTGSTVMPCNKGKASRAESFDPALVEVATSLARHFGARSQDVEDIAQDALLKLLTYRTTVDDPVAWLFVVVRRLRYRRSRLLEEPLPRVPPSFDPWPEVELAIDASRLLMRVSARGRSSIYLSLQGFTEREAAGRLGCSVKSTEKSLHETRHRIRHLFATDRGKGRVGKVALSAP